MEYLMTTGRRIFRWLVFLSVVMMTFGACEHYDPYKNPKPPSKPRKQRKHRDFNWPSIPWPEFSRPSAPPGGGGGSGSGCTRRWRVDTLNREPRHQHEPRHQREPQQREDPNGPIYPCPNHIFPFCTDENPYGVKYKSGTHGYAAWPQHDSVMGCLKKAPCPVWYYMQIDHPGHMLLYIEQHSGLIERDVDFACWGPFEAESKRDFLNKICSSYYQLNVDYHPDHRPAKGDHRHDTGGYPFDNLVDCSFDKAGTEWCYIPDAKTGEWYLILLTNYEKKKATIHFERVDEMSTATANCDIVIPITLNPIPRGLKQIDEHTSAICLNETKAMVSIELETEEDYRLPRNSLRQAKAFVYANGKVYQAKLKGDGFECEIDIENDTTEYYATVTCPDPDFTLVTEHHLIVKTTDCSSEQLEFTDVTPHYAGDELYIDLKKGEKPVTIDFSDTASIVGRLPGKEDDFRIEDYDVSVEYDELLIKRVEVEKQNGKLRLTPQLQDKQCDCFVPDTLTLRLILIPKNGDIHAKPYTVPVKIGVVHKSVWLARCLWALIAIGVLFLWILFLRLLLKKRRFKKHASIIPIYYDQYGMEKNDRADQSLRKKGFAAWLARWFWPGAEKNTLSFTYPAVSAITFVASESQEIVEIPKSSITDKMSIDGYDPDHNECARLGANGKIYVNKETGQTEGYLLFDPGKSRDGGGFRTLLGILLILSALAILALIFLIIRAIV